MAAPVDMSRKKPTFAERRKTMVAEQIRGRGLAEPRLLKAMGAVPRERFVLPQDQRLAYADGPLPIGANQTISQPYVVAFMIAMLNLEGDEKVLEIGAGSGYQAAVLGHLVSEVHAVEIHQKLAERAGIVLAELGLDNVHVHHMDGSGGLPAHAPFDGILLAAAAPKVPTALLEQLTPRGVLVAPVGRSHGQRLQRWTRTETGFDYDTSLPVSFVPLRGRHGFKRSSWRR